jgi:hypothetical protein
MGMSPSVNRSAVLPDSDVQSQQDKRVWKIRVPLEMSVQSDTLSHRFFILARARIHILRRV